MEIDRALRFYAEDHDAYPSSLEELVRSEPRYLDRDRVPLDPWGRAYRMEPGEHGSPPRVFTLGRDGLPGGSGHDRDHDSRCLPDSAL
jgi:hypothetical protein